MIQQIAVIGPNTSMCTPEMFLFGVDLGVSLSKLGTAILCGGKSGMMEAVCKGAKSSEYTFKGQTIGILPESTPQGANPYIDICIPTGIGISRNIVLVNSADVIVAVGGGAGTLSELTFAWQQKKKVLCVTQFEGWAKDFAGKNFDKRSSGLLVPVASIEEIETHLNQILKTS